jgi:hypothetical protein
LKVGIVLVLLLFRAVQTETVRLPCEASASCTTPETPTSGFNE